MYCKTHSTGRVFSKTTHRVLLGAIVAAAAACSGATPGSSQSSTENVGVGGQKLLATVCTYDAAGDMTLSLLKGEVGYLGFTGHANETFIANAVNSTGDVCTIASNKALKVTIAGTGTAGNTEELVLDFTNYASATGAADITDTIGVTLDTAVGALSTLRIIAPSAGGNMALGGTGLDIDTTLAKAVAAVTLKGSTAADAPSVVFSGGVGNDSFFGDVGGVGLAWPVTNASPWPGPHTAALTWPGTAALPAAVATAVGAAYTGPLTVSGGAGNDILAGGAGTNLLEGGDGDDVFLQSANSHAEIMQGGNGFDTVSYASRSASVTVTVGINGAVPGVALKAGSLGLGYAVGDVLTLTDTANPEVTPATLKVVTVSTTAPLGQIETWTMVSTGAGYTPGDTLTASLGSGTQAAQFTIASGAITAATLASGGANYAVGDIVTLGGTGTLKVLTVSATGAILTTSINTAGTGYTTSTAAVAVTADSVVHVPAAAGAKFVLTATTPADDGAAGEGDEVDAFVENVIGGTAADILDARANGGDDVLLQGNGGADVIHGGTGADDLCGGAGNDILYWSGCTTGGCLAGGLTGDYLSGEGGVTSAVSAADLDEANYANATSGVVVCLDMPGDTACAAQNGSTGLVDTINSTSAICPSARTFYIDCNTQPTAYTPGGTDYSCDGVTGVTQVSAGSVGTADIENVTGSSTMANTLDCQAAKACTVVGGSAGDIIVGSSATDAIFGGGGADTVTTSGGNDLVDLTHATGGPYAELVTCTGDPATYTPVVLVMTADYAASIVALPAAYGTAPNACSDVIEE
jgi:Ca2+-binding RTX toxin-like protein